MEMLLILFVELWRWVVEDLIPEIQSKIKDLRNKGD